MRTYATIFLAEVGGKTQLAAAAMAAETKRPFTAFVSAAAPPAWVSALGGAVGGALGHYHLAPDILGRWGLPERAAESNLFG